MNPKTTSSYSGKIDWNSIYRTYYQIDQIEDRIEQLLATSSEIVFCGFGEVAWVLSKGHSVHLVEYSETMAEAARREFPTITKISQANILDAIEFEKAPVVLVVCRISAYWHSTDCLQRFFLAARQSSRDMIAVDFFDADKLTGGESLGNPNFSDIRRVQDSIEDSNSQRKRPSVLLATVRGNYRVADDVNSFIETRAYYRSQEVFEFTKSLLTEYDVTIEPPIIDSDPGFTLVVRRKKYLSANNA